MNKSLIILKKKHNLTTDLKIKQALIKSKLFKTTKIIKLNLSCKIYVENRKNFDIIFSYIITLLYVTKEGIRL